MIGCVLAGLVAGAIWTWLQPDRYRADARVLVRPGSPRVVPAVEALAESSLVASNVAQTLHLSSPPHVAAKTGDGGVLTVSVEAGSRERARQVDAEAVVVLTQKVAQRFGSAGATATMLDPAHVAERTSPNPARNLIVAGLVGFGLGAGGAAALRRRTPAQVDDRHPSQGVEKRLSERLAEVAKRERSLARRAGELAASESRLRDREERLTAHERKLDARQAGLTAGEGELRRRDEELRAREATGAPEPQPVADAAPSPAVAEPEAAGGWNLKVLEEIVRAQPEKAEGQEVRTTYLFLLREHADVDGWLPASFNHLVEDVFGELADKARAREEG